MRQPPIATPTVDGVTFTAARLRTYRVRGDDLDDLRAMMGRRGPRDGTRARYSGYTHWYISMRYDLDRGPTGCAIAEVDVRLRTRMVLPELVHPDRLDGEERARWDAFLAGLGTHEAGHATIGLAVAEDLATRLAAIYGQPSCAAVHRLAHRAFQGAIDQGHRSDIEYDAETLHGVRQGASLRP